MTTQEGPQAGGPRARKPMYEDEHASCSVMLAKIRNEDKLLSLPAHDQFRWLHRFYLVLDRIAEQHRVYKLYGGPHGFMVSTGVAESDEQHASTLLRFALHVLQAVQSIKLPGMVPLDLIMVLSSGPASSGLLGTTSLTYQIVGRAASVARELMETQSALPFIVTAGMRSKLNPEVASELHPAGRLPLRCFPGEHEECYTLARFAALPLTLPSEPAGAAGPSTRAAEAAPAQDTAGAASGSAAGAAGEAAAAAGSLAGLYPAAARAAAAAGATLQAASSGEAEPGASASAQKAGKGEDRRLLQRLAAERRRQRAAAKGGSSTEGEVRHHPGAHCKHPALLASAAQLSKQEAALLRKGASSSLPRNTSSSDAWPASDLLLRFEDPVLEAAFTRYNSEQAVKGELAWLFLGLFTTVLYALAAAGRGFGTPRSRVALFQVLPLAGAALWRWRPDAFYRYREALWFLQRFAVVLATSLPVAAAAGQPPVAPLFAFGLCNLGLEAVTRRMRLHLQLFSSLLTDSLALSLMSLHPEGSIAHTLLSPSYLSLHLLVTVLAPAAIAGVCDYSARWAFLSRLQRDRRAHDALKRQAGFAPGAPAAPAGS